MLQGINGEVFMIEYIAIKDGRIVGRASSKYEICQQILSVLVDDEGKVWIGTNKDTVSYDLTQWTKDEAIVDFAHYRMKYVLPFGMEVLRCENL